MRAVVSVTLLVALFGCHRPIATHRSSAAPPRAEVIARVDPEGFAPPARERDPGLRSPGVASVGPRDDRGIAIDPMVNPRIHFTQAMDMERSSLRLEFDPPIEGSVSWQDPYRAQFVADGAFDLATSYRVRAHGELVTDDGRSLAIDERWSFTTRAPWFSLELDTTMDPLPAVDSEGPRTATMVAHTTVVEGLPTTHHRATVVITSERHMTAAALRKRVRARAWPRAGSSAQARDVPVRVLSRPSPYGGDDLLHVAAAATWPADHIVEVSVDGGIAQTDGPSARERPAVRFLVAAGAGVRLSCMEDFGDGCSPDGLLLEFDSDIPMKTLRRIEITPRPRHLQVSPWYERSVAVHGEFAVGHSYRVRLPAKARDAVGQQLLATEFAVAIVPPPPSIALPEPRGTLRAELGPTVGLQARWVRDALLRAAVPSERAWLALQGRDLASVPFPTDVERRIEREIDLAPSGAFAWSSLALDLRELAGGGTRPVFIEVIPGRVLDVARGRGTPAPVRGLYQMTDLGLAAWVSSAGTRVEVRDNTSLQPLAEVDVGVEDRSGRIRHRARTDRHGLVALPPQTELPNDAVLVARRGDDIARMPLAITDGTPGPRKPSVRLRELDRVTTSANPALPPGRAHALDQILDTVVTERAIYRPGESVSVVGWVAIATPMTDNGLSRAKTGTAVAIEIRDARGNVVATRKTSITSAGKYWARLALPEDGGLGTHELVASIGDATASARFEVRDVRVPEFAVEAVSTPNEIVRGTPVTTIARANYYYGGEVPIAASRASVQCSPRTASIPGIERDWVIASRADERDTWWQHETLAASPEVQGGNSVAIALDTSGLHPAVDYVCGSDVAIQDASFAEVGASSSWFVYASRYVLGRVRSVAPDTHELEVRSTDRDGKIRLAQPVVVDISRVERAVQRDGTWGETRKRITRCRFTTATRGDDTRCRASKLAVGSYEAVLTTEIDGEPMSLRQRFWVSQPPGPRAVVRPTWLELAAPAEVAPGDAVEVAIDGPVDDATGVLVLSHSGLRRTIPFALVDGHASVAITASDAWIPHLELSAFTVVPGHNRSAPPRVMHAHRTIRVGSEQRRLTVAIDAPSQASAGAKVPIVVRVTDPAGKAVGGSHVALWAVDEGLHALVPPRIPDLVAAFTRLVDAPTRMRETYSEMLAPYVPVEDPFTGIGWTAGGTGAGSGMGSGHGASSPSVRIGSASPPRAKFEGTPIFVGDATCDAHGVATVRGTMPDNLTTFRLTAVASAETVSGPGLGRFGQVDARLQVTAPLVVRAALPRMLRPGDEAELAILVDNLGGGAGELDLAFTRGKGGEHLAIVEAPRPTATIAAHGQVRVPVRVRATSVGTVTLEARARLTPAEGGAVLEDAVELPLAIERTKDLDRHAASYGSVDRDGPIAVELARPKDLARAQVAVDVEVAGTMLSGLQDLARDLVKYPYGCVEQTSSTMIPLAALSSLASQGFLEVDVGDHIAHGIARLQSMQVGNRGLGYWPGARHVHVWGTAYALWVLEQVRAAGYEVPASLRSNLRDELMLQLGMDESGASTRASDDDGPAIDDVAASMAVHALASAGAEPTALVEALFARRDHLPSFARALLLLAAHELAPRSTTTHTLATELLADIDERQGTASVRHEALRFDEFFDSPTRTDALVLLALGRTRPDDPAVEKLARGLIQLRAAGGLGNTQERAYALVALAEYAARREPQAADLTAEVWMGTRASAPVELVGRTAPPVHRSGTVTLDGRDDRVTVRRKGRGRMYWRVGMTWTPKDADLQPRADGIVLARSLRTAGSTTIAAGDLVAMDVTVTVDHTRRYVAIDVPLPPGLETVDETLGAGRRARVLPGARARWVSHQELRRDRAVLFADVLNTGRHTTTVFLRATTPGTFAMPAAVAHAMYSPEIRGHTARTRVEVVRPAR